MSDLKPGYRLPARVRLFRRIGRPIFRGLFHLLGEIKIVGKENIPRGTAYMIAINHISILEPPLVLAFWPVPPEAVGAVDIWSRSGQAALARWYGGIPVHRGNYDRQLLDTMVDVLKSGRPLLIAPEGGRSHTPSMRRGLPGVAYVIDRAEVPVLPVGIVGSTEDFLPKALRAKRPRIEMRIGKPFKLPALQGKGEQRRQSLQSNTDRIMLEIASLLPPEYHGVYANPQLAYPKAA